MHKVFIIFCCFVSCCVFAQESLSIDSKTELKNLDRRDIVFGQSSALSGPAKHLGINMRAGILAAFQEANKTGGVHGRLLKLKSLDDMYEPEQAVKNTRLLIKEDQVFAFIGGVGTPTSKAVLPIIEEAGIPYIGPFTGAEFLRKKHHHVINVRASYYQEAQSIVDRLVEDLNIKRVSVLYQDDSYGRAGLDGIQGALRKKKMSIVSQGSYLRNTTAVKTALLEIKLGRPQALVIVGSYLPAAEFIKLARSINFKPFFICLSFVGTEALRQELKDLNQLVVVTQVVPAPADTRLALVKNYQKAVKTNFNFVSLEAYLVGRFTVQVLREMSSDLNRKDFVKVIKDRKKFLVDRFPLEYGIEDNQGSDKVFFTVIRRGSLFPIANLKRVFK